MSILRKPYEISLWEDVWDPSSTKYVEKRIFIIGSSDMEYQGRAIEPNLIRKTNGEISFSFKMYYQFVDTITGSVVDNLFAEKIVNESKIKLRYGNEWFDLLVKNITKDSASKSYTYELVDQHVTELSKNGFHIELDSSLMNNLGTAEELGKKVLADTDWKVISEPIVSTQEEALVMLITDKKITAYKIDDSNLIQTGAIATNEPIEIEKGKGIYAFYSCCSGEQPYRFQFIYKDSSPFATTSDRVIDETGCQYYIDGLTYQATGGFVIPEGFILDIGRESDTTEIDNSSAISMLYRGRRYVYSSVSEYHVGLDMYLERYRRTPDKTVTTIREQDADSWKGLSQVGHQERWNYDNPKTEPTNNELYSLGSIVEIPHKHYDSIYVQVINPKLLVGDGTWCFVGVTVHAEYYKYNKTNYTTPNLIRNLVTNADFNGTSGWQGSSFRKPFVPTIDTTITTRIKLQLEETPIFERSVWEEKITALNTAGKGVAFRLASTPENHKPALAQKANVYIEGRISDQDNAIIQLYGALTYQGNSTKVTLKADTGADRTNSYKIYGDNQVKLESRTYIFNDDGSIKDAMEDFYSGSLTTQNKYQSALYCNIPPVKKDSYAPVVINSGPYDMRKSLEGFSTGDEYVLDMQVYQLFTDDNNNIVSFTEISNSVKVELRKLMFNSDTNSYYYDDYDDSSDPETTLLSFESAGGAQIRYDVSTKTLADSKYKWFITFPAGGGEYIITKFQIYKKILKQDSKDYYKPGENIAGNIAHTTETKFFVVVPNDNRPLEEITLYNVPNLKPVLSPNGNKKSCVNIKESNYFNAIQSIAETFKCWPQFEVHHDDNGNITAITEGEGENAVTWSKRIYFKNYVGQKNDVGFKYGINSQGIKRSLNSKQIVSKLIVKANSNEYGKNGFCSIARAAANENKDNVIYDFGYYANKRLIGAQALQSDLYTPQDLAELTNGLSKEVKIEEGNVSQYINSCNGFYPKLRAINQQLETLATLISQESLPLDRATADYNTYKTLYDTTETELQEAKEKFYKVASYSYDEVDDTRKTEIQNSTTLASYAATIVELTGTLVTAKNKYQEAEKNKKDSENAYLALKLQYDNALLLKTTLNKLFYQRYSRFIQEGTWIDESYIDDSLYYNDALSVAYNSSMPQVSYSLNVLSLAGIPGYEAFDFKVGDQTFIEDIEFFGYTEDGKPYREKVTVTQTSENLDDPSKNSIQIQNYENQFQDLFQRITATVQSVQYSEGSYKKASALAEADAAHKIEYLTGALTSASMVLENDGAQDWKLDQEGLTLTSLATGNKLRAVGGAILLGKTQDNGDDKWETGITAAGISANLLTAGIVNTGKIQIMNGDEPTFRWDAHGLTAYNFETSSDNTAYISSVDKMKGVRFDRFGLYGYYDKNGEEWIPKDLQDIDKHSSFSLTWDGLKVSSKDNNAILRIGDNSKQDELEEQDNTILKVTKKKKGGTYDSTLSITTDGDVTMKGHIEATSGKIGNMEITALNELSGKNYIINSEATITNKDYPIASYKADVTTLNMGESYTFSCFLTPGENVGFIGLYTSDKEYSDSGQLQKTSVEEKDWGKEKFYSMTFKPTKKVNGTTFYIYLINQAYTTGTNTTSSIRKVKLEPGSVATSWRLADSEVMTSNVTGSYSWEFSPTEGITMWNGARTNTNKVFSIDSANGLVVNGTIEAKSGHIGNMAIGDIENKIDTAQQTAEEAKDRADLSVLASSANNNFSWKFSPTAGMYMYNGTQTTGDIVLGVYKPTGKTSYEAYLKGEIIAESGKIAGWDITQESITKGTLGSSGFHMYSSNIAEGDEGSNAGALFGKTTSAYWALGIGSTFGVTDDGKLYASGGNIGGFSIGTLSGWNAPSLYSYNTGTISQDAVSKKFIASYTNETAAAPATSVSISSFGIRTAVSAKGLTGSSTADLTPERCVEMRGGTLFVYGSGRSVNGYLYTGMKFGDSRIFFYAWNTNPLYLANPDDSQYLRYTWGLKYNNNAWSAGFI